MDDQSSVNFDDCKKWRSYPDKTESFGRLTRLNVDLLFMYPYIASQDLASNFVSITKPTDKYNFVRQQNKLYIGELQVYNVFRKTNRFPL